LYLYGTKFKIITDHRPLVWLFNVTDPVSRLIRWRSSEARGVRLWNSTQGRQR